MLENLTRAISLARENPAGKTGFLPFEATVPGDPVFQTGLQQDGDIAGLPYGALVSNVWQSLTGQRLPANRCRCRAGELGSVCDLHPPDEYGQIEFSRTDDPDGRRQWNAHH